MYVDCLFDRDKDRIHVVERDKDGKRQYREFPVKYIFYSQDIAMLAASTMYGNIVLRSIFIY